MTSLRFSVNAAAFAAVLLCATQAMGATWTLTGGKYSNASGAQHETFDTLAVDPQESANLDWTTNKAIVLTGSNSDKKCYSPGTIGNYLCVRGTAVVPGWAAIDLSETPTDYYGFRWASVDWYNTVSFYDGEILLLSLTGSKIRESNGDKGSSFLHVYADAGQSITRVVLESSKNSFESDNHAVRFMAQSLAPYAPIASVPEPSTYALLLAGLGLVGFAARRSRR